MKKILPKALQAAGFFLLSGLVFGSPGQVLQQKVLSDGWEIKMISPVKQLPDDMRLGTRKKMTDTDWIQVREMPAMIHDILLQNKLIEAPWLPGKAEEYLWVAENDWVYSTQFQMEKPDSESFLVFQGLDGIADVYLNDKKIASHSNMFIPLRINVTGKLRKDNNLLLHFKTVFKQIDGKAMPIHNVDGDSDKPVRRPKWNYNSYLGAKPYLTRVGVFDEIILETTGGSRITELLAGSSLSEDLRHARVSLNMKGECNSKNVRLKITLSGPDGKEEYSNMVPVKVNGEKIEQELSFDIPDPELWWPRGYGDQSLYKLETALFVNEQLHQTVSRTLGFRRLIMTDTLHFEVNGKPVKLWGSNWVTPHWHTAVWDRSRVEKLIEMAENANFNAFRVHGTGKSPADEFYELADKKGFMIWQDFTSLPLAKDEKSVEICKNEATYLLKRLKHHPSIFVWCGGNENAMWHDQEFNPRLEDRGEWPGLAAAAELAKICRQLDPDRYFQPSSPYYGMDPNDPQEGNTHGYTNIWFVPGYDFVNFASEDTRIAAPVLKSLRRFMAPEDIWPENYPVAYTHGKKYLFPENWLKYTGSESWKKTGPLEQFYDADDAASLVHNLGMAASLYYQETIERQRRGRPATDPSDQRQCGGYLFWKFNDSWPQIYSAKVDYFLEPYHAYYAIRRAFEPVILSFDLDNFYYLWTVNDSPDTVSGTVKISLFHPGRNEVRKKITRDVILPPGKSGVVVRLDQAGIGTFHRDHILSAILIDQGGNTLASAITYGDIERRMDFPDAKLDISIRNEELIITTDKFARCICLEGSEKGDEFGWLFDDNYFDLLPGEEKTVKILGDHRKGTISAKPWYSPFSTDVSWQGGRTDEDN